MRERYAEERISVVRRGERSGTPLLIFPQVHARVRGRSKIERNIERERERKNTVEEVAVLGETVVGVEIAEDRTDDGDIG